MVIISNESFGKQPGQNCQIQLYFMKFGTSEYLFCSRLDNRVQLYYRDIKVTNRITEFVILEGHSSEFLVMGSFTWKIMKIYHLNAYLILAAFFDLILAKNRVWTWLGSFTEHFFKPVNHPRHQIGTFFDENCLLSQKVSQNWQLILIISPIYPLYRLIWLPIGHLDYSLF